MKDVKKYDKVMDHLKFFTFNSVLGTHYGFKKDVYYVIGLKINTACV